MSVAKYTFIQKSILGDYLLLINSGGSAPWLRFEFRMEYDPTVSGVIFELSPDADEVSKKWFPSLLRGMQQGFEAKNTMYVAWVAIRVTVLKIYSHPVSTTDAGCEYYGLSFVYDYFNLSSDFFELVEIV